MGLRVGRGAGPGFGRLVGRRVGDLVGLGVGNCVGANEELGLLGIVYGEFVGPKGSYQIHGRSKLYELLMQITRAETMGQTTSSPVSTYSEVHTSFLQ